MRVRLFFMHMPHMKFQDPSISGSWVSQLPKSVTDGRTDRPDNFSEVRGIETIKVESSQTPAQLNFMIFVRKFTSNGTCQLHYWQLPQGLFVAQCSQGTARLCEWCRKSGSGSLNTVILLLLCCFASKVNNYGHVGTVSEPNHSFPGQAPGRVAQSVGRLTRKSGVLGSIPGLATYFRFSFRVFKKGSFQLQAKVCARSTG